MSRYLYTTKHGTVNRYKVSRETDHTIWIESNAILSGKVNETRISKKTMGVGSGWHITYYHEETDHLLSQYKEHVLNCKFQTAVKFLERKQSNETKRAIIEIVENLRKEVK